jgi:hypothetical protein
MQQAMDQAADAARRGDFETARRFEREAAGELELITQLSQQAAEAAEAAREQERRIFEQEKDSPRWREADANARALEEQAQRTLQIANDGRRAMAAMERALTEMERKARQLRPSPRAAAVGLGALGIGIAALAIFLLLPAGAAPVPPAQVLADPLPGSGALSWGDTHLVTFDGLSVDFQAVGEFVLVRADGDGLEVQVRQRPAGDSETVSRNTAIAASVAGDTVSLDVEQDPPLHVNGVQTAVPEEPITLPNGGQVEFDGERTYSLTWPDGSILRLPIWGANKWLDVRVYIAESLAGAVTGLLGDADGDPANDLTAGDGTVVSIEDPSYEDLYRGFGDSWRIRQEESLFVYQAGESTATFTDVAFPSQVVTIESLSEEARRDAAQACRDAGVTEEPFLASCVLDVALTGDALFAAAAAAIQAAVSEPPTPTAFGDMHLEVTGDLETTIDLSFDREASSYFPPDGLMTLNWRNEAGQSLVIGTTVFSGTRAGVTVQMQLNEDGTGFSHNAFGDQCRVTVTTQEEDSVAGRIFCAFPDITVSGPFEATFP